MQFLHESYEIAHLHPALCSLCGATTLTAVESGPIMDLLKDQSVPRGTTVTLTVAFEATSPVTIIWRVDLTEIWRGAYCIPHGQTRLTIRRFDFVHHRKRFSVEIVDRRGRRVWTAGTLKMRH